MDDIETILNTLIYDGKVEMTVIAAKEGTVGSVDGQMKLYRGVNAVLPPAGLVKTPCGLCPVSRAPAPPAAALAAALTPPPPLPPISLQVFDDCHEGGEISPSTCIYMTEWLEF